jgi:hypothetical protein
VWGCLGTLRRGVVVLLLVFGSLLSTEVPSIAAPPRVDCVATPADPACSTPSPSVSPSSSPADPSPSPTASSTAPPVYQLDQGQFDFIALGLSLLLFVGGAVMVAGWAR